MINPPIKWMGGKSQLRERIIAEFPKHTTYVEVFGGAAWVLFGKTPSKVEVYNDVNSELVNFFRVAKHRPEELIGALDLLPVSRELFLEWKHADLSTLNEVTRAARFYYLIHLCFGARFAGTKPQSDLGYSLASPPGFNPDRVREDIRRAFERIKRVYIEHLDCLEVIKRYDSPDTLFFCDPPYVATHGYGGDGFGDGDQRRLAESLQGIEGRFLLTNSDHPLIRELYEGCFFQEVDVFYSAGTSKVEGAREKEREVIVTNYKRHATLFDGLAGLVS